MSLRRRLRTLLGAATVVVLLALIVLDTVDPAVTLSIEDRALLTSLIAALLGADMLLTHLPLTVEVRNDDE